jgi:arginyl-tRNA synthetase
MGKVLAILEDKVVTDEHKRKVLFVNGHEIPLILSKSDRSYTYDTLDLAALHCRLFEDNADQIIYVVDSGQSLHFKLLFQSASDLNWSSHTNKLVHVHFGIVLGADVKKLKPRSGKTIKLQDLLDEAYKRAYNITKQLNPGWSVKT